ncbi:MULTISPECIES: DUF1361 domain-containing protein [Niastella]|uniref:DUF1361 domain-containing protein n=1 Tax=Niastella soli TaxID=2821487 RepID=A0ABS3YMM7_9BACT|nr:DUF1361 domain-containing protein [Niastella soli]MBO9199104.1 DUF1361 domain-containing protein [Niastella soli]
MMKVAQMKPISKPYRWMFFNTPLNEIDRMLTLSMGFSIALVMARIVYTDKFTFIWLIWNLFLAWVPYVISSWLQKQTEMQEQKWKFFAIAVIWLLFIPNSFYILTDLFHLGKFHNVPNWFDLTLIISFAWNGLLLGVLSVRQIERMVQKYFPGKHELVFIFPIMWLNAIGVYIGRYPRFNSWDVVTNPIGLCAYLVKMICHPVQYVYAWGMVACFSVFMTLVYLTIKRISKAIH